MICHRLIRRITPRVASVMFLGWKYAAMAMAGLPSTVGAVPCVTSPVLVLDHRWQEFTLVPGRLVADGETVIVRGVVRAAAQAAGRPMDGYGGSVCARVHGHAWAEAAADQPSRHRTVVAGARHLTAARALSAGRIRRGGMMRQDNNVEVAREAFAGWSCPRGQMPVLRRLATWPADLESNLRGLLSVQLCYLCGARKNDDMMTGSTAARFSFAGFRLLPGP
jgi:hypothetical protein